MIIEHAKVMVHAGQERAFEVAFERAPAVLARGGARSVELTRCIEDPAAYVIFVGWDTVEDHTIRFRESEVFDQWRALVSGFLAEPPTFTHHRTIMRHRVLTSGSGG